MKFSNKVLSQGLDTKMNVPFVQIEITLPEHIVSSIENITPISEHYNQDVIYAELLSIGLHHLDELTSGTVAE